jgi:hypothetical protein
MNLYKVSQYVNTYYDTYDSMIVAAETVEAASNISPTNNAYGVPYAQWCEPHQVIVELIGVAKKGTTEGVILSSFNAG